MSEAPSDVTRILQLASNASDATDQLLPILYDELRRLAQDRLAGERGPHTLQATALVHEAYGRLVDDRAVAWSSRRHFFGSAAEAMRRVLIDHARRRNAKKRGGGTMRAIVTLGAVEGDAAMTMGLDRVLVVDEAITQLADEDPRAGEIVRLRFFGGLETAEIAAALDVSERTVMREWAFARARLAQLLGDGESRPQDGQPPS